MRRPNQLPMGIFFSRSISRVILQAFVAVLIANIVSVLAMNAGVLPAGFLVPVYLAGLFGGILIARRVEFPAFENPAIQLSGREQWWLRAGYVVLFLLYVLPRTSYLLESAFGYSIDAISWDDYWHIQELNSLINSPRYPPASSFGDAWYLSHYYAAWMLPAALHKLLSFNAVTIKVVLFIGETIYTFFILFMAAYAATILSRNKTQFFALQYLVVLYSGAESLLVFVAPLVSHKWWMKDLFGVRIQISDFSDLTLWVKHHLVAAASLILAWLLYTRMKEPPLRKGTWMVTVAAVSLLLVNGFYGSIFVFLGASVYIAYVALRDLRSHTREVVTIGAFSTVLILPILWLYMGKKVGFEFLDSVRPYSSLLHVGSLTWLDIVLSLCVFLLCMAAHFAFHAWVLRRSMGRMIRENRELAFLTFVSAGLVASTFVIFFANGNDFAMRATIVPVLVLSYAVSAHVPTMPWRVSTLVVLAVFALNGLNEIAIFNKSNIRNLVRPPAELELRTQLYRCNTDRTLTFVRDTSFASALTRNDDLTFYLCEKMIPGTRKHLWYADIEITNRGPFGPWRYQRWQADSMQAQEGSTPPVRPASPM